ncbi:hypothetical protein GGTG_12448 [Gaeumannomyces tritici R3-111a-1]|uniref:Uncharacterized protein n=1 Tax=Gaeumannomyces tritici (strain R3-111a-1) TaxID=644352 RepID=J3PG22_GAET3|nr:hypothetical protein GGTG_12448 [Gaeumannomyces tritici R3-111a-1]EJT70275.1 hypothetical protein GGTG_12448 [Gaeumannomyces tritici R3-111a-1]
MVGRPRAPIHSLSAFGSSLGFPVLLADSSDVKTCYLRRPRVPRQLYSALTQSVILSDGIRHRLKSDLEYDVDPQEARRVPYRPLIDSNLAVDEAKALAENDHETEPMTGRHGLPKTAPCLRIRTGAGHPCRAPVQILHAKAWNSVPALGDSLLCDTGTASSVSPGVSATIAVGVVLFVVALAALWLRKTGKEAGRGGGGGGGGGGTPSSILPPVLTPGWCPTPPPPQQLPSGLGISLAPQSSSSHDIAPFREQEPGAQRQEQEQERQQRLAEMMPQQGEVRATAARCKDR